MYRNKYITAMITAAGEGLRMGANIPKLELKIEGKRVIDYTVEVFKNLDYIDEILIVTSENLLDEYTKRYNDDKTKVVLGGASREESTYRGLKEVSNLCEYILCHDGARPFVKSEDIEKVLCAAIDTGAAIIGVPAVDTIKVVKNGIVVDTPNRENLYNIQTPQVFKAEDILLAYDKFYGKIKATDDSSYLEKLGKEIHIVEGSYNNIKITTQKDLEIGRSILCE